MRWILLPLVALVAFTFLALPAITTALNALDATLAGLK